MSTTDTSQKNLSLVDVPCPLCGGMDRRYERTLNGYRLVRCLCCGAVHQNPQCTVGDLMYIYKEKRDAGFLIDLYKRLHTDSVLAEYDRKLAILESLLPTKGRILDFACAAAYFVEQASRRGWDAHGVDVGDWSRTAAESRGVRNVHVGLLSELRFPDGYFDVVFAAQVLEHLPSPAGDLAEIRRILRPGGILYVDVPNYHTLPIMLNRDDFYLNMPPQHLLYFTPKTLRKLLCDSGFEVDWVRTEGGLKWENLIGRPVVSDVADAYRSSSSKSPESARIEAASPMGPSTLKKVLRPLVKTLFYQWAKVGMVLVALARRPPHC